MSNGSSRRVAARYVGCAPATIGRTAVRDPQFAAQLAHAEHQAEIKLLRAIQIAAEEQKFWRAAAWLLERRNPEDFAPRCPRLLTAAQVSDMFTQVVELLRGDVPEENCRRALGKLDAWLFEFQTADAPVIVQDENDKNDQHRTLINESDLAPLQTNTANP